MTVPNYPGEPYLEQSYPISDPEQVEQALKKIIYDHGDAIKKSFMVPQHQIRHITYPLGGGEYASEPAIPVSRGPQTTAADYNLIHYGVNFTPQHYDKNTMKWYNAMVQKEEPVKPDDGWTFDINRNGYVKDGITVKAPLKLSNGKVLEYPPPMKPEIRIGDATRTRYIEYLGTMYSGGYLTKEEFESRMELASTAKAESHLKTLVEDLPPMPSPFRGEPVLYEPPRTGLRKGTLPLTAFMIATPAIPFMFNAAWTLGNSHPLATAMAVLLMIISAAGVILSSAIRWGNRNV